MPMEWCRPADASETEPTGRGLNRWCSTMTVVDATDVMAHVRQSLNQGAIVDVRVAIRPGDPMSPTNNTGPTNGNEV
jgi:hypothetical protein